jgi:hypothetical protein
MKNKLKHTEGEWRSYRQQEHSGEDIGYRVEQVGLERTICHVYEPAEANARLIAAAPEMLDCLIWIYKKVPILLILGKMIRKKIKPIIEKASGKKIEEILNEKK